MRTNRIFGKGSNSEREAVINFQILFTCFTTLRAEQSAQPKLPAYIHYRIDGTHSGVNEGDPYELHLLESASQTRLDSGLSDHFRTDANAAG